MTRWLRFAVRLALGITLVVLIVRRLDLRALRTLEPRAASTGILAAAALLLAGQLLAALRWRVILGSVRVRWAYLARLYLVGGFASLFLPTLVGGDALRAASAARATGEPAAVISSVLLDRVVGLVGMMTYLALGIVIAPTQARLMSAGLTWSLTPSPLLMALGAVVALAVVTMVLRVARVRTALQRAWETAAQLFAAPTRAGMAFALALVVQGIYLLLWIVLARATALPLPATTFLIAVPLVTLGGMLPLTLAGLGIREGVWLLLLRDSGLAPERIVAFSLSYFVCNLVVGGVGGLLYVWLGVIATDRAARESAVEFVPTRPTTAATSKSGVDA